jgi:hypothetical protein
VGIGNTNSFAGATSLTGLAISDRGGLFKLAVNDVMYLSNNLYYDGTNWKRIVANGGTFIQLESTDGGTLRVFAAATGTAGSNATTIDRLMINSSGNVGIGTGSPNSEASATNLVVRGVSGKTNGWVQALSLDGLSGVAFYSGSSSADNPSLIYLKDLRFGRSGDAGTTGYVEQMRLTNGGNLIVGPENGATTTARITSYLGSSVISGTNDGFRLQVQSYSNAARNTIAWGQNGQDLTLGRFGIEWNSGTSQMNFIWRDMYNSTTGTTENMRLTAAGHLQVPNQPYFKYGIGDRTITSLVRFGTDWSFPVLTARDSVDSAHFNKANGRFTAPVAGTYIFGCTIMRGGSVGSGPIDFQIVKNEPNPIGQSSSSTYGRGYSDAYTANYQQITITVTIKLAANDYVALDFSGNMSTYGDDSWYYGYLLG